MKERIVIKDEFWVKHFQEREKDFYEEDMCSGGKPEGWWHYEKEKVPETFEELKELCKNIKGCYIGENYINLSEKWLSFLNDGQIICHFYFITNNATPQQMWQIIKSLIGEE